MKDLTELTPAPWHAEPWNTFPNGYLYGPLPCHSDPIPPGLMKYHPPMSFRWTDAEWIALARNAFDVMMRRGWGVDTDDSDPPRWFPIVDSRQGDAHHVLYGKMPGTELPDWPDPFTALVEADEWLKKQEKR